MKRFWTDVSVADGAVLLDGKPVRTPARATLVLPGAALAEAIAAEWRAVGEELDPRAMPLTCLANAAIDRAGQPGFADSIAKYAETDVLCYRADEQPELARRQAGGWDPVLEWARRRYDVHFVVVAGIVHSAQPAATVARLAAAVLALDAWRLAALQPLVTIGGSLVTALALLEGEVSAAQGFDLTHLDELWQAEHWGEDWMATDARDARRRDWDAAARFLGLL